MPILNGFLRGAHDEEITANIDQKQYQGVPVNTYNWIGTKRGGLSKRAPFKLQRTLDQESYIIPYSFDDDEKYLLQFYKTESGDTKYKVLKYTDGALIDSSFGGTEYTQPIFTSNTSDGHKISTTSNIIGANAYKMFTEMSEPISVSGSDDVSLEIEFPSPVLLRTIEYVYGNQALWFSGGFYATTMLEITDENGVKTKINSIANKGYSIGAGLYKQPTTDINQEALFAKKLKITFKDHKKVEAEETKQRIGNIKLTGQIKVESSEKNSPITYEQIQSVRYYNTFRKMFIVHADFKPKELILDFKDGEYADIDSGLGNPTTVTLFQQRLAFSGFTKAPRRILLSESKQYHNFKLNTEETLSTDPIDGVIDEMKSPITSLFSGRQMLYAQSMDGLGSLNSGADDVPLTATQVSARLRNQTPLSKTIQPIKQDEIVYCVGADNKTVYALDYDYQYARIPLHQLNEHCISYFDSGIKQMVQMKGKLPYIVFLLNDGSLIFAICYRNSMGFNFYAFPQKPADGEIINIATLQNTTTGHDALFVINLHSNGQYAIESIESYTDFYTEKKGEDYFKTHILLDTKQELTQKYNTDMFITYTGDVGENKKKKFLVQQNLYAWKYSGAKGEPVEEFIDKEYIYTLKPEAPGAYKPFYQKNWEKIGTVYGNNVSGYESMESPIDPYTILIGPTLSAIVSNYSCVFYTRAPSADIINDRTEKIKNGVKLLINGKEIICENCIFDEEGYLWAETSEKPDKVVSSGYAFPEKTFNMPEYIGLPVQAFDGNNFIEKESENGLKRTITLKKPIYSGEFGLPYKAYSEFINIVDVNSAPYETIINSMSACITYGTGIKIGTESALEKIGYTEYPYTKWQHKILPDESLKNVVLNDRGVKNKRIVLECEFPFPANVTFITYDIKATGVR